MDPSGLMERPWWRESLTQVVRSSLVAEFFGRVLVRVIRSVARSYSKKPLKNDTWKYSLDSSGEKTAGRTASEWSPRPIASSRSRMSITLTCSYVVASTTVMRRLPFVQSSQGASSAVFTSPMDMFQRYLPSRVKMFSCGLSPVLKEPSSSPVEMSSTCTVLEVEADTATREPSGDRAMWSER
ncbi:hypothetical protein GCM10010385_50200 [Streptomyces geysiriensis]|nr:hypothetical protein GCM10010385_50200 [Streptomyces geysiriensis]